jgi:hypothetical protein
MIQRPIAEAAVDGERCRLFHRAGDVILHCRCDGIALRERVNGGSFAFHCITAISPAVNNVSFGFRRHCPGNYGCAARKSVLRTGNSL